MHRAKLKRFGKNSKEEIPHITIIREDLFGEPFHHKTEAYAAAGTLPDVMYMWPGGRSTTLHTKKLVKDLTPFIVKCAHEFSEAALQPPTGGYLAMIPMTITASHAMYVNKGLLDSAGLREFPKPTTKTW